MSSEITGEAMGKHQAVVLIETLQAFDMLSKEHRQYKVLAVDCDERPWIVTVKSPSKRPSADPSFPIDPDELVDGESAQDWPGNYKPEAWMNPTEDVVTTDSRHVILCRNFRGTADPAVILSNAYSVLPDLIATLQEAVDIIREETHVMRTDYTQQILDKADRVLAIAKLKNDT